jgi:hypothetical protein
MLRERGGGAGRAEQWRVGGKRIKKALAVGARAFPTLNNYTDLIQLV